MWDHLLACLSSLLQSGIVIQFLIDLYDLNSSEDFKPVTL